MMNRIYSLTDCGKKRKNNEDFAFASFFPFFAGLLVCDGVGGNRKGEVCSTLCGELTIQYLNNLEEDDLKDEAKIVKTLKRLFSFIQERVKEMQISSEIYSNMASTYTLALVFDTKTYILHVGDSACYTFSREKELRKVTYSDTLFNFAHDNHLTFSDISDLKMNNTLIAAVGIKNSVIPHISIIDNDYDKLLLCSDGLYNMVNNQEITKILSKKLFNTKEKCEILIKTANSNGGKDNIGVSLLEVVN